MVMSAKPLRKTLEYGQHSQQTVYLPDHSSISKTNGKWCASWRHERIGRVKNGPNNQTNEGVDEELDHEEITQVVLGLTREGTENAGRAAIENTRQAFRGKGGIILKELYAVHAHDEQTSHERAHDLREDVVRNLAPWEALPEGKAKGDGRVEVTT